MMKYNQKGVEEALESLKTGYSFTDILNNITQLDKEVIYF